MKRRWNKTIRVITGVLLIVSQVSFGSMLPVYAANPPDDTSLVQAITSAQNLTANDQQDYTEVAWTALQSKLQQAINVDQNPQATQEMVDAATAALQTAISKRWVTIDDTIVTKTEGNPLNQFYYYSPNSSWVRNKTDRMTYDNPNRTDQDYASITFVGTQIQLFAKKGDKEGAIAVSIDSGAETEVDEHNYDGTSLLNQLVYTSPDLQYKQHTLKVRCENKITGTGSNGSVNVDAVRIRQFDPAEPTGFYVSSSDVILTAGETINISAYVYDLAGNQLDLPLTWQSDDKNIATVNNGAITGVAAGQTVIRVSSNQLSATINVRVQTGTDQTAPGEVTGLKATAGYGQVTLNWVDPTDQDLQAIKITVDTA